MSIYKYLREAWKNQDAEMKEIWRQRKIKWRRQPVTVRIEKPTRLDRARSLGYKAKPGIFIVRQRVLRGGHRSPESDGIGRKPCVYRARLDLMKSYQSVAEQRAGRKYMQNCEVLNSYFVGQDGKNYWYEVILVDKSHPAIISDPHYNWVLHPANRGRVFRGLTSAGKKARGLRYIGTGAEKARPSRRAVYRRKNARKISRGRPVTFGRKE